MQPVKITDDDRRREIAPEQAPADAAAPAPPPPDRRMRLLRTAGLAVALLLGLVALTHWLIGRFTHVYVIDSRIAAHVIAVGSEANGRVLDIPVVAGDRVARGDLLVRLESRQVELQLQETSAEIARIEADQGRLRAQQDMIRRTTATDLAAGRAKIEAAEAAHRAAEAELETARNEYQRMRTLLADGGVSRQQYEERRAHYLTAQQEALGAAADIREARASLAGEEAQAAEITVIERQIEVLDAERRALLARRARQQVELEQREIRAAFDGVVDATFVDVGEYVSPGTRLLMYHDPGEVWVDANVKETEFRRLEIGAPATITVDAYPDREFHGKIVRLGYAATSQFALLPNPNPSGNFTKVTQRLPVRIAVEQQSALLRPGMMVEASIDVVD